MSSSAFGLLLLSLFVASCSLMGKGGDSTGLDAKDEEKIYAKMSELHEELKNDLRTYLRKELVPELQRSGLSQSARKNQLKAQKAAQKKIVLGRVEWVTFVSNSMKLRARVDSGAQTSSMHAVNVVEKQIEGKDYVQFESEDFQGKNHVFLKEVVKTARVRSSNGDLSKRYVVKMKISLGARQHNINVNLNDREKLDYNFLIGRNLLMGNYIVDVSQSQLLEE